MKTRDIPDRHARTAAIGRTHRIAATVRSAALLVSLSACGARTALLTERDGATTADVPRDVALDVPRDVALDVPRDDAWDASLDLAADTPCGGLLCGGRCVNPAADVEHCGGCGRACPTTANGAAECSDGRCGITCRDGFTLVGGACRTPAGPRLVAPISTARLNSSRPTLRWVTAAGAVTVEVCADRACATPQVSQTAAVGATSLTLASSLSRGVHFWRVRADFNGTSAVSGVWEFLVDSSTPRTAPASQVLGLFLDLNGDGNEDAAISAPGSGSSGGRVHVLYGDGAGLPTTTSRRLQGTHGDYFGFGHSVDAAGDLNGDGFGDLVVGQNSVNLPRANDVTRRG